MKLIRFSILLLIVCLVPGFTEKDTSLVIKFENIRNENGYLLVSLCDAPEQFPNQPKWKYRISKSDLKDQGNVYQIKKVVSGKYAIAIIDDENCDMVLQRNLLGIPREGYGFSNNIKPTIKGAPEFEACTFAVQEGMVTTIMIEVQYMFKDPEKNKDN